MLCVYLLLLPLPLSEVLLVPVSFVDFPGQVMYLYAEPDVLLRQIVVHLVQVLGFCVQE